MDRIFLTQVPGFTALQMIHRLALGLEYHEYTVTEICYITEVK